MQIEVGPGNLLFAGILGPRALLNLRSSSTQTGFSNRNSFSQLRRLMESNNG